ncbi:hypothetical protein AB0F17_16020 [Nonomuraea sp. NPDC026600]|uniref:hypothetical protein n=1 Tax=Nonomuraea sp. NPDC026600 TaxID=3155363 RepID=UPI0033D7F2D5
MQEESEYGRKLRAKNLQVRTGGWTWNTRDQVLADTPDRKTVRDQAGNDVTERTDENGGYHRDVTINLRS